MNVWQQTKRTKTTAWRDLAIISPIAVGVLIISAWFDFFERFAAWSARYNKWQVNELVSVIAFLAIAFAIFSWRRWRELKAETTRRREYSNLFRLANDPILIFDAAEATVLDANDRACQVYGIARDKFIGRKLEEISQDPLGARRRMELVRNNGKIEDFEVVHLRADGEPIHFLVNQSLIEYQGRSAILSIDRDITERNRAEETLRRAEQKYREIFENVAEGIFQTSVDGKFITANPALARMLGFDSAEELIATRTDIAHEHYVNPEDREEFKRLLAERGQVRDFVHEAFRKDGKTIWISEDVQAARDDNGTVLYYEGTSRDITERKSAELTSAAFAALARKLSGARTYTEAGFIIAQTARELFGWDACNLDLYDVQLDLVHPLLNVDTIDGQQVDVTPLISALPPTPRTRRVLDHEPELILREEPIDFDSDSVPFGDTSRPSASLMLVPIKHGDEVVGLLSVQSYAIHAYDQAALRNLVALAEHCGEAINRIRAEESLRESEERYRDLVENSHELICTHDLDGWILSANLAAAVALGYDRDAFVGKGNIRDILAPEVRGQFAEYMTTLQEKGFTSGVMVVQTSSGEKRYWEYYNSLRTEGVATPVVRGMARDITEQRLTAKALRESEQRYRELFENSRDAIYVHDLNGRYVSVNQAAERLTGFTREEIIGKHYSNFIGPRYLKNARENFCLKFDVPVETTYEAEVVCKSGKRTPVEVSSRMIYKDGIVIGVQGTVRDITERKRAEDVLQTYSRRLIEAQEAERQKIARELHDEIGQVLTAVSLNLQAIKSTCDTESCVPRIDESMNIVEEALKQVRELSLELRPSLLDDLGLVAALRWYVARYNLRSGITAEVACESDISGIPHEVSTVCFRIAQEALTNSARHSRATKASVEVQKRNGDLRLAIQDNGIGFDSELFLHGMPSFALGLRGMQERVLTVNGRIEINSKVGKGTEVVVFVPLKK